MNIKPKRIMVSTALLFVVLGAQAQDVRPENSDGAQTDSIQMLTEEMRQFRADLKAEEKQKHLEQVWQRRKFWKIGFGGQGLKRTDGLEMDWQTDFSVSLQQGKTAYLHSKPIAGILKFGIDFGFLDVTYSKLKLKSVAEDNIEGDVYIPDTNPGGGFDDIVSQDPSDNPMGLLGINLGMHKIEYGLHVGPSISVNPWDHLFAKTYFQVRPTASGIIENSKFSFGYGCVMTAGLSVSYKLISVGIEGVWGTISYRQLSFNEEENDAETDEDDPNLFNTKKFKLKQAAPRFYVAFRF